MKVTRMQVVNPVSFQGKLQDMMQRSGAQQAFGMNPIGFRSNPVNKTWICPIDGVHRFTGDNSAYDAYLAHFDAAHTLIKADGVAPGDAPISGAPEGYQFVEFNVQQLFAKATGGRVPFIHVRRLMGEFAYHKELGTQTQWFSANFILLLAGAGEDKGLNPDNYFFYQGGPKQGAFTETFDGGPIEVGETLIMARLQAYPRLENGAFNTQDKIDGVTITLWGYV